MSAKYYDTITEDSSPVYGWIIDFGSWWDKDDWIRWYQLMKSQYGQSQAQQRFLQAWNDAPFGAQNINWRTNEPDFIEWAKKENIYDALFFGVLGAGMSLVGKTAQAVTNVGSFFSWLTENLSIIFIIALVFSGFIIYLRYGKK